MRGFRTKRWVVPVASLLLVLGIAATAWAATDSAAGEQAASDEDAAAVEAAPAEFGFGFGMGGGPGGRGMRGPALSDEQRQALEERREEMQQRRDAYLDVIRDKMSAEDQQKFDELRNSAEQQRTVVEEAMEKLRDTRTQIRDLVDKYLGVDPSGESTTTTVAPSGTSL